MYDFARNASQTRCFERSGRRIPDKEILATRDGRRKLARARTADLVLSDYRRALQITCRSPIRLRAGTSLQGCAVARSRRGGGRQRGLKILRICEESLLITYAAQGLYAPGAGSYIVRVPSRFSRAARGRVCVYTRQTVLGGWLPRFLLARHLTTRPTALPRPRKNGGSKPGTGANPRCAESLTSAMRRHCGLAGLASRFSLSG